MECHFLLKLKLMKKIIIGLLLFSFLGSEIMAKAAEYTSELVECEEVIFFKKKIKRTDAEKINLNSYFLKKIKKGKNKGVRVFKRLFYKKNKKTPPRKGDDLWILKVIYLVALLSILTFALSAIMLAIGGMSSLWLTLMIVGGVIGVLPLVVIGGALLFQ
jgi:hypothetical protein